MRSKRQAQIVRMVEGYDSTFTISVALRNVFLVWTAYGLLMLVLAILALATNPSGDPTASVQGLLSAMQTASGPLFLLTLVMCGGWMSKSVANVRRLGRKANFGVFARLKRHIVAGCLGFMAVLFAVFIPPLALTLVLVAAGLWIYSALWFDLVLLDAVRMLWGTSSPPQGQHEDVDHYVLVWFWSWFLFVPFLSADITPATVSPTLANVLLVVAGASCFVSAFLASRLVMDISRRQDDRLFAIIREVDDEADKPVTDQDITAAWNRSATMLDLPY